MFCIISALLSCLGDQRQWYSLPLCIFLTLLPVPKQYAQSPLLLKYRLLNSTVHAKFTRSFKETVLTSDGAAQVKCVGKNLMGHDWFTWYRCVVSHITCKQRRKTFVASTNTGTQQQDFIVWWFVKALLARLVTAIAWHRYWANSSCCCSSTSTSNCDTADLNLSITGISRLDISIPFCWKHKITNILLFALKTTQF
jgi:hypothetical protein